MKTLARLIRRYVLATAGIILGVVALLLGMTPLAAFAEDSTSANGWQFKAFGTSSAANSNTLAEGADSHNKVTLNACTVKEDGTIFPF